MVKKKKVSRVEKEVKLRKNFYAFQKKVNRLQEIKHELSVLESKGLTKGFEKEVNLIRSRLKDTTAVGILEKRMERLRKAIRNKRVVKKVSPIKKIESRVSKIDNRIGASGDKISRSVARVDLHLEDSQKELKSEIKNLKLQLDKSLTKKSAVDSRVGFVVDDGFQDFLKGVKMDLSERVKNKEVQLNSQLRKDLDLRRRDLEGEYKSMKDKLTSDIGNEESRLKQSYELRVKNGLKREVAERFAEELRKKFDAERDKLDVAYISMLKKKYHGEYVRQRKNMEERFRIKIDKEIRKLDSEHKSLEVGERLKFQKRLGSIDAKKKALENRLMKEFSAIGFEKEQQRQIVKNKLKSLEQEREKFRASLRANLIKIDKQKNTAIAKVRKESDKYGKQLAKEHQDGLAKDVAEYRVKVSEELKKEFVQKMNRFVSVQKAERDRVIKTRLIGLTKQLAHQNKVNELLKENVSQRDLELEEMKQRNSELVNQSVAVKNEEVKKYQAVQKMLIQKHKTDIQKLTNSLESGFKSRFNEELRNRVKEERESLNREYETKRAELATRTKTHSILQRAAYRQGLKKKYDDMYRRNVNSISKKLRDQLRREFKSRANSALRDERKKLAIELSNLESEKSRLAVDMQRSLSLKLNKILSDEKIKHDSDIASRTKQLSEAIDGQREINDVLRGKISRKEIEMKKARESARKESERRKIALDKKIARERADSEQRVAKEKADAEKERIVLERKVSQEKADMEKRNAELRIAFEKKKSETNALLARKEKELAKVRQSNVISLEASKAKSREILEKQRKENVNLLASLTKSKHASELSKHEQKRKLLEQHKTEMQRSSDKLKREFNQKFDNEIKDHISDERARLKEMMRVDLDKAKDRMKMASSRDTREYKRKLDDYYQQKLRQSTEKQKKRLREMLNKEFADESKKAFESEKKRLENRLKEYELKYKADQSALKIKEKNLIESNRTRNIELATERERFGRRLNLMKRQEDLIIKKERVRLQKEIGEREHKRMLEVLSRREALLKAKYKKDFGDKLILEHKAQEQELAKKRAELADELRKKASALLS